jgi:peroxiredoxin
MSKKFTAALVFSTVLLGLSLAAPSVSVRAEDAVMKSEAIVGQQAPDFSLTDIDGKTVKLSDFKGKLVVLEWFNDECPFVQKHYKTDNMQKLQRDYTAKGVVWLTICSSGKGKPGNHTDDEYKKLLSQWKAQPTHFLVDADGQVGKLYGAKSTPDMFVVGQKGDLAYSGAIDDKPTPDADSVASAKNYVREALDSTLAGKSIATRSTKSYGCSVKYAG